MQHEQFHILQQQLMSVKHIKPLIRLVKLPWHAYLFEYDAPDAPDRYPKASLRYMVIAYSSGY